MSPASESAKQWRCGDFVFDLRRPLLMGIVNATPDSFSDGGRFVGADSAVAHGLKLLEEGAALVDVGGESTRPAAIAADAETEKRRILPVIERLAKEGAAVSADTMKAEVMQSALDAGACVLNDVCGFAAAESRAVAAASDCGVVIMHMQGAPQTMQNVPHYGDVVGEVGAFLQARARMLADEGVADARICVDPGIGFGKTAEHNLQLMRNLPQIGEGRPLLLGVSRKSWLRAVCGESVSPDSDGWLLRDVSSAAAAAILSRRGAAILRVHNVAATRAAMQVAAALEEK